METRYDLFISYSRRDIDAMNRVVEILEAKGFSIWTDKNLVAGTPSWKNSIEQAITNSTCVIVLLSPDSKSSTWVERELEYASLRGRRIFPILVKGSEIDAIPFELVNLQYVDARKTLDEAIDKLEIGIHRYLEHSVNDQSYVETLEFHDVSDNFRRLISRVVKFLKLIIWYFFYPHLLTRLDAMSKNDVELQINSWLQSSIFWFVIGFSMLIAFPGIRDDISDTLILVIFIICIMSFWNYAQLSSRTRDLRTFIKLMFRRILVLSTSILIFLLFTWRLVEWFSFQPSQIDSIKSLFQFSLAVFLIFVVAGNFIGSISGISKYNSQILGILTALGILVYSQWVNNSNLLFSILAITLYISLYALVFLILKKITLRIRMRFTKPIILIVSNGIATSFSTIIIQHYLFINIFQIEEWNILYFTIDNMFIEVFLFFIGAILIPTLLLVAVGSLFDIRISEMLIVLGATLVPMIITIVALSFLVVQYSNQILSDTLYEGSLFINLIPALTVMASIIAAAIASRIIYSMSFGINLTVIIAVLALLSTLLNDNAFYFGIGLRGILLLVLVFTLFVRSSFFEHEIPIIFLTLSFFFVFWGLLSGITESPDGWIIFAFASVTIAVIWFRKDFASLIRSSAISYRIFSIVQLVLIALVPILYYFNI